MCGIAGFLSSEPASPAILKRMTDAIQHRGPDSEGFFIDGGVGLGHRRLAIIDLSPAAHQPMQSPSGRYVLSYNGEVYNFQELRIELEKLGHPFRSRSDSEVVLAAFEEWGVTAFSKLNGMFALSIWDLKTKTLTLARDRYGIKPLYLCQRNGSFGFGSEIKALLAHPSFSPSLDRLALVEYFTFQNYFTDRTLFDGVSILPAGHYLQISTDLKPKSTQYWDFCFKEELPIRDPREYDEELRRLFVQAVSRQLVGDVPVGAYLSGGLDSGAITMLASRQMTDLNTFTVGFDMNSVSGLELGFDERTVAEKISYLAKTSHYEMVLKSGDMEKVFRPLVRAIEEPRVGQSYPNYFAAHLASKFVKVVLAGSGGDELFGGYPWRYYRAVANQNFESYCDRYYQFWQRLIPDDARDQLFSPLGGLAKEVNAREIFKSVFPKHLRETKLSKPEDYVNLSLYFEAKTFLHGILVVDDKLSMAHSLENRVPFLDNDLVDFSMRVPVRMKLGQLDEAVKINENDFYKSVKSYERTRDGKLILRKMMKEFLPDEQVTAIKQGFSGPDATWFRGSSIDYVQSRLLSPRAKIYEYLDRKTVHGLVNDHLESRENRRLLIWSLLYFEEFCESFLG